MDLVFGKEVISCVPKLKYIKSKNRGSNMSDVVLLRKNELNARFTELFLAFLQ